MIHNKLKQFPQLYQINKKKDDHQLNKSFYKLIEQMITKWTEKMHFFRVKHNVVILYWQF